MWYLLKKTNPYFLIFTCSITKYTG